MSCVYCQEVLDYGDDKYCDKCLRVNIISKLEAEASLEEILDNLDIEKHIISSKRNNFNLTKSQINSLEYVHTIAKIESEKAEYRFKKRLLILDLTEADYDLIVNHIKYMAPCIVHVHLGKYYRYLMKDTHYRNQFETGNSSGSKNLHYRRNWENNIFKFFYDKAKNCERVKYGCFNIWSFPNGVNQAYNYGRSYFLLKKNVRYRVTFTNQDSSNFDCKIADPFHFLHILEEYSDDNIIDLLLTIKSPTYISKDRHHTYREMQIHGDLRLDRDVETLFIHPKDYEAVPKEDIQKFREKNGFNVVFMEDG